MPLSLSQDTFLSFLNRTFLVYALAYEADGGQTMSLAATEAGRMRPMRPDEVLSGQRLDPTGNPSHILYVAAPTAAERGRYIVDSAETGIHYRVIGPREPSEAGHHVALYLEQKPGPVPTVTA